MGITAIHLSRLRGGDLDQGKQKLPVGIELILLPFSSSASANICNVVLMRHTELEEGIDVLDTNGNIVGSSRVAAKHVSTGAGRAGPQLIPAPAHPTASGIHGFGSWEWRRCREHGNLGAW